MAAAICHDSESLQFASPALQKDAVLVSMKAILDNPSALHNFPEMQNDHSFLMVLVGRNGLALEYLAANWQDSYELVEKAVEQNPLALAYASPRLCGDRSLVIKAITSNAEALQHASFDCRWDRELISIAMKRSFLALKHVPEEICWQPSFLDEVANHVEFRDYASRQNSMTKLVRRNLRKEEQKMYAVVAHIYGQQQSRRRHLSKTCAIHNSDLLQPR